jgi:hypothetical protein
MSKTQYLLKIYEDKSNCVCVTTQFNQQVDRKDTGIYIAHMYRYRREFFHSINT